MKKQLRNGCKVAAISIPILLSGCFDGTNETSLPINTDIDSDYDGIPDVHDVMPHVSDYPDHSIDVQDVLVGMDFDLSGSQQLTFKRSNSYSSSSSESASQTTTNSLNTTRSVTQSIAGNLAYSGSFSGSVGVNASKSKKKMKQFTFQQQSKSQSTQTAKTASQSIDISKIDYKSNSGFIHSGLQIVNMSNDKFVIKDMEVRVSEFSPKDGKEIVIDVIKIPTDIEVYPSTDRFPFVAEPLHKDNVPTDRILSVQQKGKHIKIAIQKYNVLYKGRLISSQTMERRIERNSIRLDISDQKGEYASYHVFDNDNIDFTLDWALRQVTKGKMTIQPKEQASGSMNNWYLQEFNGVKSEFISWGDPRRYFKKELSQGAWVVLSEQAGGQPFSSDQVVHPGSAYSVAFVTKEAVFNQISEPEMLVKKEFGNEVRVYDESTLYWDIPRPYLKGTRTPIQEDTYRRALIDYKRRFDKINNHLSPDVLQDDSFKINPGEKIKLDVAMMHNPIPASIQTQRIDDTKGQQVKTGCKGSIRRLPGDKFEPLVSPDIREYELSLRFSDDYKSIPLQEFLDNGQGEFYVDRNGKVSITIDPNDLVTRKNTSFEVHVGKKRKLVKIGRNVRCLVQGRRTKGFEFEEKNIRELRYGDVSVSLIRRPNAL